MSSSGDNAREQNDMMAKVLAAVEKYQCEIDEDMETREGIRTVVRDIEKASKKIYFVIFNIHSDPSEANLKSTGTKLKEILESSIHNFVTLLRQQIPEKEYYKYNDHFKHTFQRLAYFGILSNYLLNGSISTIDETASLIGLNPVESRRDQTLMLDYDDYLIGLLDLAQEFSRFSRNCVTFGGNIKRVYDIHELMNQMNAGMHNITFKNDYLRRRYDGLKYNIKAVEEVIYDLKIRGINNGVGDAGAPPGGATEDTARSDLKQD